MVRFAGSDDAATQVRFHFGPLEWVPWAGFEMVLVVPFRHPGVAAAG